MKYKYVIGYLRLSQDDGDKKDESCSIKNQRMLIRQHIAGMLEFADLKVKFFSDDGYSGSNYSRPAFAEMMEMVKRDSPCCIIVKDLSRLGRDTIDTQNYLEKVFPFLGVRFIAVNDGYDSGSESVSGSGMEMKFKNLVNGLYPQMCSRNIKQAKKKIAETGRYAGAIPPFGYKFSEGDRSSLMVDRESSWIVRLIFDKRLAGERYSDIAKSLNSSGIITPAEYLKGKGFSCLNSSVIPMWTVQNVRKILFNPVYAGIMVNHKTENAVIAVKSAHLLPREEWICVRGTHEAVVTEEEQEKVMSMVRHYGRYDPGARIPRNIFKGRLKCGYCRRRLRVRSEYGRKNIRAYCDTPGRMDGTGCHKGAFNLSDIEKAVLALIRQQAAAAEDALKNVKLLNKALDIPKMNRQLEAFEKKINGGNTRKMELYEQYAVGEIDKDRYLKAKENVSQEMAGYKEKAAALQEEIAKAEAEKEKGNSPALQSFSKYAEQDGLSYEIVQELVEVIYFYDPEHIEVIWNFRDEYLEMIDSIGKKQIETGR